jgi:plastocyanin
MVLPAGASAAAKTVSAGPPQSAQGLATKTLGKKFFTTYNPDVNDFFLHRVTIHAGDSVTFVQSGFHTIDLPGTAGKALPLISAGAPITGVNDAAGNPFWFNGKLPSLSFTPALLTRSKGTTYDGTTRLDSGLPSFNGKPKPFTIKFTKSGTYKYFCDVHPGMVGFVTVKPKNATIPTAKQDAAALTTQLKRDLAEAKPLSKTKVGPNKVSLGEAGRNGVELYAMFPSTLTVKAGSVVTFSISKQSLEVHTATFGPTKYLTDLDQGLLVDLGQTAQGLYPSDPPPSPIPLSPTLHGNGFGNIGAVDNDVVTPNLSAGQVKFTTPGTYQFICLVHPLMHGKVVVTP